MYEEHGFFFKSFIEPVWLGEMLNKLLGTKKKGPKGCANLSTIQLVQEKSSQKKILSLDGSDVFSTKREWIFYSPDSDMITL